jgi:hypothetical protein
VKVSGTYAASGASITGTQTYLTAGTYTVTLSVTDKDGETGADALNQPVIVVTPEQALGQAALILNSLATGAGLGSGNANSLATKINAAQRQLTMDNAIPAANQLQSLLNELDALIQSGRLRAADAVALHTLVKRVIRSIS